MEEPQIIHYYQQLPEYAIIIENLNEEYNQLTDNYIQLSERIQPYIPPPHNKDNLNFFLILIVIFQTVIILWYISI